jgi:RNA polymerase sigma factor (sigma-70 family)
MPGRPPKARAPLSVEQQALVARYHRLAARVATRYAATMPPAVAEAIDWVAEAHLALCHAAAAYCARNGCSFWTFAYYRVHGAMIDCARRAYPKGFRPQHRDRTRGGDRPVPFVAPFAVAAAGTAGDPEAWGVVLIAAAADPAAVAEARDGVDRALRGLPEIDRSLLWWRFAEERTLGEIAARCGYTESNVKRRIARSLAWLGGSAPPPRRPHTAAGRRRHARARQEAARALSA